MSASIRFSWKPLFALALALVVLLFTGRSFAQTQAITASLTGTITDAQGKSVTGAQVTLSSTDKGILRTYTTADNGFYTFTLLPPAVYSLQVEAAGFKHYKQEGIELIPGQTADQQVTLVVGAVSEVVEVTSQATLLNAENANISADVAAKQIVDLPLNFRSVISLAMLSSSVSNTAEYQVVGGSGLSGTADQDVSFLNFGGTFFDTAAYLLDGTYDTRADWGGVIYTPSVDAVQELKIQTNAFTAQYGWSSGNVVNIVTKSGSNEFHGDAYEFYSNSDLFARNFFNSGPEPAFNRNQFGGTLGGPIRKDKTFFFAYYEGLRQSTPVTNTYTVPTAAERTGNFAALLGSQTGTDYEGRPVYAGELYNPFSTRQVTCGQVDPVTGNTVGNCPTGATTEFIRDPLSGNIVTGTGVTNVIPATLIDSLASKIASGNYWPNPTTSALVNNYTATAGAPEHSNEYSVRVDHNFNDDNRLYARWSQKFQTKTNTPDFFGGSDEGGPGLVNPNNRYSFNLGYNHVFDPTFVMSAIFGINRHVEGGQTQGFGFQSSTLGLPSFVDSIAPAFPQFTETGYAGLGASGGNNNYITPQTLWTQSVDFTKTRGNHAFAFGFMNVWLRTDGGHYGTTDLNFGSGSTAGPDPQNPTATGDGFASFLLGVAMNGSCGGCANNQTAYEAFPATDKNFVGWYFQDSWRMTRKLTLNLGLRYEIQTAPRERRNQQQYFDYTATNPISYQVGFLVPGEIVFNSPGNRGLYNTPYTNIAPRIGLAYQLLDKLVFRSGYGIFYVPNFYGQGPNDGFSQATPWVTTVNGGLNPSSTLSGNTNANCGTVTAFAPCPSAFPNGERQPSGSSAGGLQDVGFGTTGVNPNRQTPYVQQWMAGLQYAFTPNQMLDVSYVGNHGIHDLYGSLNWDVLSPTNMALGSQLYNTVPNPFYGHIASSGCGLNNPTIVEGQLLLPFPEYCGLSGTEPSLGESTYNALQLTYRYRWHSGMDINVSYTYSKFLDNVQGQSGWAFPGNGTNFENAYNLAAERSVDVSNQPNSLVVNYNYELPFGKGKAFGSGWSSPVNAILGGWQWSGILTAKSGLPISPGDDINNTNSFGGAQRPNLVVGVSLKPANQTINDWINPAAFSQPAASTFGDAPRFLADFHGPAYFNWDMGIQKWWTVRENMKIQFRFEMFNALNHPDFFQPDANLGDPNFGIINQAYPSRSVQFAGKFYW
jgi:hypothetical protein